MQDPPNHKLRTACQSRCDMFRRRGQGNRTGARAQRGLRRQQPGAAHARPPSDDQHPTKHALMGRSRPGERPRGDRSKQAHGPRRGQGGRCAGKVRVGPLPHPIPRFPRKSPSLRQEKALGHRGAKHRARGRTRVRCQAAR